MIRRLSQRLSTSRFLVAGVSSHAHAYTQQAPRSTAVAMAAVTVGVVAWVWSSSAAQCESVGEQLQSQRLQLQRIEQLLLSQASSAASSSRASSPSGKGVVDVILGAQWGDEGKGKLTDIISSKYAICARVAGGSNAGHTIVVKGRKYKFHLVPSAILNPNVTCVVGNGVVVHLRGLLAEMDGLEAANVDYKGRLLLSDRAHIVFDFHQQIDAINEGNLGKNKLGTTLKGIGPSYGSKVQRNGVRIGDLRDFDYFEQRLRNLVAALQRQYPTLQVDIDAELNYYRGVRERLLPLIVDSVSFCQKALNSGKNILIEGANATMLDLDFGTYPYVTSSNPSVGSTLTGLGVSPKFINNITGIVKAYCTRVGEGPFPTELLDTTGQTLREKGGEYGTTTGRPRRCGWIDIPQLKYSLAVNGIDDINLTKLDVLTGMPEISIGAKYLYPDGTECETMPSDLRTYASLTVQWEKMPGWTEDISKCKTFSELPINCQRYVNRLEELIGQKIKYIGVGPGREDIIAKE